jgi:hypothetical protein
MPPGGPRAGSPPAPPNAQMGPPPDDWASAIPTDVPAAQRAADPSATQVWRPDEVGGEPGVPLGPGGQPSRRSGAQAPAGAPPGAPGAPRRRRRPPREASAGPADLSGADPRTTESAWETTDDPGAVRRTAPVDTGKARRNRPPGERQARAWPRVVAVISWILLLMVLCWYYVFPWLERVLPENF